jgi:hypothetical protein
MKITSKKEMKGTLHLKKSSFGAHTYCPLLIENCVT